MVPINAEPRSAELRYLLEHSELCLAISLPERIASLLEAAGAAAGAKGRQAGFVTGQVLYVCGGTSVGSLTL